MRSFLKTSLAVQAVLGILTYGQLISYEIECSEDSEINRKTS